MRGETTSWCDKLASTPTAGFGLSHHFIAGDSILEAVGPILERTVKDDIWHFSIDDHRSFSASFNTEAGYKYSVSPNSISVQFNHRMKNKLTSGGPPIMELLSRAMPYSQLLPEVSKRLIEATLLLPNPKTRTINRVGIVSATAVAENEVPPGIMKFMKYIGRPWQGSIESFNTQITAELGKTANSKDRCIHNIIKYEDKEELLVIQFDWQRKFNSGRSINSESLEEMLTAAEKASMKYFEDLAEGNLFDEGLITERPGA